MIDTHICKAHKHEDKHTWFIHNIHYCSSTTEPVTTHVPATSIPDPLSLCSPNPCLNGGTCKPTSDGHFLCSCSPGFSGHFCLDPGNCFRCTSCYDIIGPILSDMLKKKSWNLEGCPGIHFHVCLSVCLYAGYREHFLAEFLDWVILDTWKRSVFVYEIFIFTIFIAFFSTLFSI